MKKTWADAARGAEVRDAAAAWRDAGAIDAPTLEAIRAAYPESRPELSKPWIVLIFFLVTMAVHTVSFGVFAAFRMESAAVVIFLGAVLATAADFLRGSRFTGNGSDAAVSFWAITYLLVGIGWSLGEASHDEAATITTILVAAVAFFAAACVRWGFAAYGTFAAASFFGLLGRFPGGRLWWVAAAAALLALAFRNLDRASLAPPHRNAVAGVFAVAAIALYVALNRVSVDQHWIEALLRAPSREPGTSHGALRVLSTAATALLPPAFVAWGLRARRTLILDLGLAFAAASLVTLRYYVHLAPLWLLLTAAGAVLVLGALWLNRLLRRSPGGVRGGFTADPLFSGRSEGLQAAAVVAGFTASPAPARSGELSTGGGRFGGGGSSGEF
ncbi:MAG TPA: hypothetical protein VGK26_03940 [Thermoanaerobaculia bacterium]|jgi:hypothetical protein